MLAGDTQGAQGEAEGKGPASVEGPGRQPLALGGGVDEVRQGLECGYSPLQGEGKWRAKQELGEQPWAWLRCCHLRGAWSDLPGPLPPPQLLPRLQQLRFLLACLHLSTPLLCGGSRTERGGLLWSPRAGGGGEEELT